MGLGKVEASTRVDYLLEALRTTPLSNITRDIRARVHSVLTGPLNPPRPPVPSRNEVDVLV